jgi:hypothetical protein
MGDLEQRIETRIHPGRWKLLTLWIVTFTFLTAYALYAQREAARSTDRRFCDVTSSFLKSERDLRDQLNKGDLILIGRRQTLQEAARNGSYVFSLAPTTPVLQGPLRSAILNFFQAIDDLQQTQVRLGQQALGRTDAFVTRLDQLRRRLKCPK